LKKPPATSRQQPASRFQQPVNSEKAFSDQLTKVFSLHLLVAIGWLLVAI